MEIANVEMAAAWDGDEGEHWASHEERYNAAVLRHHARLLAAAHIAPPDDVLDLGCGCGATTRDVGRAATGGTALGIDLSARMIERARDHTRAEGLTNVRYEQADAQVHPFEARGFDLAMSRFGAMFFNDPLAAFRNIGCSLRPAGRVALLAWRPLPENEWLTAIRAALALGRTLPEPPIGAPGPFGLADPDAVTSILTTVGFVDIAFEKVDQPFLFGTDAEDAYRFVSRISVVRGLLEGVAESDQTRALEQLYSTIERHDTGDGVWFDSAAWLITARRAED
ncbi:MAG TPA: class I SAM-dependent methyltransferase [Acidimicrobiia bacterium]